MEVVQDGVTNLLCHWKFDFPAILANHSHSVLGPKQLTKLGLLTSLARNPSRAINNRIAWSRVGRQVLWQGGQPPPSYGRNCKVQAWRAIAAHN